MLLFGSSDNSLLKDDILFYECRLCVFLIDMYTHYCAYVYLYIILANHIRLLKTPVQLLQYNVSLLISYISYIYAMIWCICPFASSGFIVIVLMFFSRLHRCCKPTGKRLNYQQPTIFDTNPMSSIIMMMIIKSWKSFVETSFSHVMKAPMLFGDAIQFGSLW